MTIAPPVSALTGGVPANGATIDTGITTVLQEQLGLKLEGRRDRVDVIVIDHVDRPTPD